MSQSVKRIWSSERDVNRRLQTPTSMVLRFRDLVAETIKEHQAIIQKAGYVWWGWWNKPDERIPRPTFEGFSQTMAREKYLSIYLIDSGRQLLYDAKLL